MLETPVEFERLQGIEIVSQVLDTQAVFGSFEILEGLDEFCEFLYRDIQISVRDGVSFTEGLEGPDEYFAIVLRVFQHG